jgi:hypothetical protein
LLSSLVMMQVLSPGKPSLLMVDGRICEHLLAIVNLYRLSCCREASPFDYAWFLPYVMIPGLQFLPIYSSTLILPRLNFGICINSYCMARHVQNDFLTVGASRCRPDSFRIKLLHDCAPDYKPALAECINSCRAKPGRWFSEEQGPMISLHYKEILWKL